VETFRQLLLLSACHIFWPSNLWPNVSTTVCYLGIRHSFWRSTLYFALPSFTQCQLNLATCYSGCCICLSILCWPCRTVQCHKVAEGFALPAATASFSLQFTVPLSAAEHFRLLALGYGTACHQRSRRHHL